MDTTCSVSKQDTSFINFATNCASFQGYLLNGDYADSIEAEPEKLNVRPHVSHLVQTVGFLI